MGLIARVSRNKMKIAFLFTCYNRIEKTKACVESITRAMEYCSKNDIIVEDLWFVTDAGSTDGTAGMLKELIGASKLHLREGDSDLFYSSGMRESLKMLCETGLAKEVDYYFLINDDVSFYEDFLYRMLCEVKDSQADACLVGATCADGRQTYGGVRYLKWKGKKSLLPASVHYTMVGINDKDRSCHTFNANCVMLPAKTIEACGAMDGYYNHSLGDFDYGMCICKSGFLINTSTFYVGQCQNNKREGTWNDRSLSRVQRIKKLNSVKGAPTKYWFYYLRKHFGVTTAIAHSISPYVRILLGR